MIKGLLRTISIFCLFALTSWSCHNNQTTLVFENNSNSKIDSVLFTVNNCSYKVYEINARSRFEKKVVFDTLKLNNHDMMVSATIFIKDSLPKYSYDYTDLSGTLEDEYKIIMSENFSTRWWVKY